MSCDICGKNDATVHLTEIVDGEMTKMHLCEECARKKGAEMEEHFGLSDLLAGLADLDVKLPQKEESKIECPNCGLTYQDFKKIGRLGCGQPGLQHRPGDRPDRPNYHFGSRSGL